MKIYRPFEKDIPTGGVATLGFFDGVHKGHSAILARVKQEASANGATPLVLTLWPHPRIVLNKNAENLFLLNTLEEKTTRIAQNGLEHFAVIPFSHELAQLSPEAFFKAYFVDWLKLSKLIIGYDHHIGKDGAGDFSAMQRLGKKYGIEVEQVDALAYNNTNISSTKIRNLIAAGKMQDAASFLGYPYFVTGVVVEGFRLGRKLGFPTANIKVPDAHKLIPADGVYAVQVNIDGFTYSGMLNIGYRPTVNKGDQHKSIEVNIFDFNRPIYGTTITVSFVERIRSELEFGSVEELQLQLQKDKEMAISLLKNLNS